MKFLELDEQVLPMVKINTAMFNDAIIQIIIPEVVLKLTLPAFWSQAVFSSFTHKNFVLESHFLHEGQLPFSV